MGVVYRKLYKGIVMYAVWFNSHLVIIYHLAWSQKHWNVLTISSIANSHREINLGLRAGFSGLGMLTRGQLEPRCLGRTESQACC